MHAPDHTPSPRPSVVTYAPAGPYGRILAPLAMCALAGACVAFGVSYRRGDSAGPMAFAAAFAWLVGASSVARYVRVEVDRTAQTLRVVLLRWPLPPRRRSFPLSAVRDAVLVETRRTRTAVSVTVGLVVDGEGEPVQVGPPSRSPLLTGETVREVRALLAAR